MDLIQLKYFHVLSELQHMTQAANSLHIAQPALSRTLRNLEQELGLQLFDRVGKNLCLNENGQILQRHTRVILQEVEDALRELAEQKGLVSQHVSLSMFAGSKLLPDLIRGFKQRYPDISLQIIQQGIPDEAAGKCDIMIFSSITPPSDTGNTMTLMEEEICLALPVSNPLSNRREISLADAAGEPFICLHKGKGLRTVTDEYCRIAGFSPHIILESDSPGTVRELIALGVGLAFIPMVSWQGMDKDPNVRIVKISEPRCRRYVNMTWRKSEYVSRAAVLMRKYLIEFFSDASGLSE